MSDDCLFCRIVRREIPATLVAETRDAIAFRDINPQAPVHILVVPRSHVRSLDDVTDPGLLGRLMLFASDIARREGIAEPGYRVVVNTNGHGGQTVFHLHLHVLGGRHLQWPPG